MHSRDMIGDLGTWHVNNLELVNQYSRWINEFSWMKKDTRRFSVKKIDEIRLSKEEIVARQEENLLKYRSEIHENEHQNT